MIIINGGDVSLEKYDNWELPSPMIEYHILGIVRKNWRFIGWCL